MSLFVVSRLFTGKKSTQIKTSDSGVLIYEMCQGHGPFFAEDTAEIYERIREAHVFLPNTFSSNLKRLLVGNENDDVDLRKGLLVADVTL